MIPNFKYHPDPIATGAIHASDETCLCCGGMRIYTYTGPVYTAEYLQGQLCPWCIADGSASQKFDAIFSDDHALTMAGIDQAIIEEVTKRTPGFTSWQQQGWLTCCDDACAFYGDASRQDLKEFKGEELEKFISENHSTITEWINLLNHYEPGGDPGIYKFVCRHCHKTKLAMDYS